MPLPFLLSPATDTPQRMRLRRFALASLIYTACVPLTLLAHALGLVGLVAVAATIAAMVVVNIVLLTMFGSGANRRFRDPSLTGVQLAAGLVVLMAFFYAMDRERSLALILYPVVLLFGTFRLGTREFLRVSGFVLAGHGLVIVALVWTRPQTVDLPVELFRWLVIGCLLPCFALIAGKVSELRHRLRQANAELRSAIVTIEQMARRDALTGLANRASFNENLDRAVSRAHRHGGRIALLCLDLDGFKRVNDTLGHPAGDAVLTEVARRIAGSVREGDVAARLGGDEFVVLVESFDDRAALAEIAQRVLGAIDAPIRIGTRDVRLTASIGIGVCEGRTADAHHLVSRADAALYRAKAEGRNTWRFDPAAAASPSAANATD